MCVSLQPAGSQSWCCLCGIYTAYRYTSKFIHWLLLLTESTLLGALPRLRGGLRPNINTCVCEVIAFGNCWKRDFSHALVHTASASPGPRALHSHISTVMITSVISNYRQLLHIILRRLEWWWGVVSYG